MFTTISWQLIQAFGNSAAPLDATGSAKNATM